MVEKSADILVPGPDESALTRHGKAEPATADTADTERELAGILADVVHADRIHAESHFFTDLGANSLVMAQFCARVRKHPQLPSVSMKDIYRHPTLRELAAALVAAA
ncbi:acyl carrier protein, partial [Streptomyces sp. Tu 6176]|uniref:acyl carrier protein n=1 Tax=Streptomyces sp. Tu 6176 TaxID=1470557 RepID=UPI000569EAB8